MQIKREILGERIGTAFGTVIFVLTDKELRDAYEEYILIHGRAKHEQRIDRGQEKSHRKV